MVPGFRAVAHHIEAGVCAVEAQRLIGLGAHAHREDHGVSGEIVIHAVLVRIGHMIFGNLLGSGGEYIVEVGDGFPCIGEHGAVVHDGGIRSQLIPHLDDGDRVAVLRQEHTGLYAHFTAADDHNVLADLLGVHNGIGGNGDIFALCAGNAGDYRLCAHSGDDGVIAVFHHGRGGFGIQHYLDALFVDLMDQVVLVVPEGPLEGDVVCMTDGAAQLMLLLVDGDLMATVCQIQGCAHAAGAAADDGDLLAGACGLADIAIHHFKAKLGVYGTYGGHDVVLAPAMALVAAEAGDDIILAALVDLVTVVGVGDPCPAMATMSSLPSAMARSAISGSK